MRCDRRVLDNSVLGPGEVVLRGRLVLRLLPVLAELRTLLTDLPVQALMRRLKLLQRLVPSGVQPRGFLPRRFLRNGGLLRLLLGGGGGELSEVVPRLVATRRLGIGSRFPCVTLIG